MKQVIFFSLFTSFFLFSCSSDPAAKTDEKQELISRIDSFHSKMINPQTMELNKALAGQAIAAYDEYVKKFPHDSLSPEYLFRISDLSRGMGDQARALDALKVLCANYPEYKKIPESIFLQGYYLQEFFGDTSGAKEFYKQLIAKYPDHPFSDDARALMDMFGKSEEEIIKSFEEKAKAQQKK